MLKQTSWHQRLLWVLRYTTWSKSQLPLESWHFTLNCAATFGVMLVIITQNGKTNTSSNRNRHINRTKSCFPPPCNVAQRNISYIRTPVDSVSVWGSDLEENRRKDFRGVFYIFFFILMYPTSQNNKRLCTFQPYLPIKKQYLWITSTMNSSCYCCKWPLFNIIPLVSVFGLVEGLKTLF